MLEEHGYTQNTAESGEKKSPWILIAKEARDQIRSIGSELGVTASSRARIKVETKKKPDPFEEYKPKEARLMIIFSDFEQGLLSRLQPFERQARRSHITEEQRAKCVWLTVTSIEFATECAVLSLHPTLEYHRKKTMSAPG
jgi:hypothetical protein